MPRFFTIVIMLAATNIVFAQADAPAEVGASDSESKTIDHWIGVADEMAKAQKIATLDSPEEVFQLRSDAVFRHTQSVRGGDDIGAMYVWTTKTGRPAAIGVFFSWSQGRDRWVMQEFHSLSDRPIRKEMEGQTTWKCPVPGLQWNQSADLPGPDTDERRLKLQARQFPRTLRFETKSGDNQRWELRSVPKPFYEYIDKDARIEYGAIFGFCQGTDTEVLVMIEARLDGDKRGWYYALAPFSDYGITATLADSSKWQSPDGSLNENGKPHYWSFVEKRPKPDFEK